MVAFKRHQESKDMQKKTICPLDCPDACGVIASLEDGVITRIDGDPEHPFTNGFLCKKVRTYHDRVQSEDRILYPQKRVGRKGEGKFERISWDEAWTILVDKLTEIKASDGGEALLPYSYAGNMGKVNFHAGHPFFHKYGASRLNRTICSTAAKAGWNLHYGANPQSPPEKVLDSNIVIAWGINAKVTNIHFMPFVVKARRLGARFIVIDPYQNITAEAADDHYRIKPGGDAALALGLLKILTEAKRIDQSFIDEYSEGFEDLATYLADHTLEEFAQTTGLTIEAIRELANVLADNPKTFIRVGVGLSRNTQGAMATRAIACLSAALGLFDGKVGAGALLSSQSFTLDQSVFTFASLAEKPTRIINMVRLGEALTEASPAIKSLFVYSSNPLSVAPDSSKVRQGLEREDLFTIVHEQFHTSTTRYADLLLPATTSFENDDIYIGFGHFYMGRTEPVIAPKGESISNFALFQKLALKMGFNDAEFQQSIDERIQTYMPAIAGLPQDYVEQGSPAGETIRSEFYEMGGDFTQFTGQRFKFTLANSSADSSPHPRMVARQELDNPSLSRKYPFALLTPPNADLLNSTFGERYPGKLGKVMVHPTDAACADIADNDLVEIYNHRGKNLRHAEVTDKTQPGLLVAAGIYWQTEASQHTGINDLTSQATTDMGEGGTFHESRVAIRKV
jgi:anaerobic selenocysteine-containing dehydrogenase